MATQHPQGRFSGEAMSCSNEELLSSNKFRTWTTLTDSCCLTHICCLPTCTDEKCGEKIIAIAKANQKLIVATIGKASCLVPLLDTEGLSPRVAVNKESIKNKFMKRVIHQWKWKLASARTKLHHIVYPGRRYWFDLANNQSYLAFRHLQID